MSNQFNKLAKKQSYEATPPLDKFAAEKEKNLDKLEIEVTNIAQQLVKSMEKEDENVDCYELAIKEGLRSLNPANILDCITQIFEIILKYQSK